MTRKRIQKRNKSSLGLLLAEYRDRPLTWRDLVLTFTPAALAALTPVAYGGWRSWWGSLHYGPAVRQAWGTPWYLLSGLATLCLLWLAWLRLRRSGRWVRVYQDGLVIHTSGGRQHVFTWREISGVSYQETRLSFLGRVYRTRYQLALHRQPKHTFRIDPGLPGLPELAARIKARLYPQQLPQLRQQFKTGQELAFGTISLSKSGITIRSQAFTWAQIRLLDLRAGRLVVELHNQREIQLPAREIPNIELLLQLIREGAEA